MKIIIADDHVLFRETLKEYIQRNYPSAHIQFSNDFYGVLDILQDDPDHDLALLDLRMPGMNDNQGFQTMQERYPNVKTALMSGLAEANDVREALNSGIVGYFPKTMKSKDLMAGIEQIMDGEKFLPVDPDTHTLMKSYADDPSDPYPASQSRQTGIAMQETQKPFETSADIDLTRREENVLTYLLQGAPNKIIASELSIQEVTVKLHIRGICRKLNVNNRTQAALKARELGLEGRA